jgi:hypothetical protein
MPTQAASKARPHIIAAWQHGSTAAEAKQHQQSVKTWELKPAYSQGGAELIAYAVAGYAKQMPMSSAVRITNNSACWSRPHVYIMSAA